MKQITIPEKLFKEISKIVYSNSDPNNFEFMNIVDIRFIKEEKSMPTKRIMTRAEAIVLCADYMAYNKESATKIIDFYIKTGMLTVKEEELSFIQAVHAKVVHEKNINVTITTIGDVLAVIKSMGYEVKAI